MYTLSIFIHILPLLFLHNPIQSTTTFTIYHLPICARSLYLYISLYLFSSKSKPIDDDIYHLWRPFLATMTTFIIIKHQLLTTTAYTVGFIHWSIKTATVFVNLRLNCWLLRHLLYFLYTRFFRLTTIFIKFPFRFPTILIHHHCCYRVLIYFTRSCFTPSPNTVIFKYHFTI